MHKKKAASQGLGVREFLYETRVGYHVETAAALDSEILSFLLFTKRRFGAAL